MPHKKYIPYIPALVYLVCFYSQSILQSDIFMALFSVQFPALQYFIFSVYPNLNFTECFPVHFKHFCKFVLQTDIFKAIFQHLLSFLKF